MSMNNLFIVKRKVPNILSGLDEISNDIVKLALNKRIGINFNVRGYHDELLKLLNVRGDYFCVSDSFSCIETDDLFDLNDCLTDDAFFNKYAFLNEIIAILFAQSNIASVDFYIAHSYCYMLSDYKNVKVENANLTKAFIDEILLQVKEKGYCGIPTAKFEISNNKHMRRGQFAEQMGTGAIC